MALYDGLGAVCWCFVVRFNILCGAHLHGLWCALRMLTDCSAGKEISKEEGAMSLMPSSTIVADAFLAEAVWMSSYDCSR
jgi:hypothetical protein